MINVSDVVNDADLAQPITIERSSGSFQLGGFVSTVATVAATAVVTVATELELDMVPEADRISGAMTFYTSAALYETHAGNTPGLSDRLLWRGDRFRLVKIFPYTDYGFSKAVGVRMSGK